MRRNMLARGLAALLCIVLAGSIPQAGAQKSDAPVRRALLIGIDDYRAVPGLMGAVNDVATLRELLRNRWGFADRNIELLTDAAATRAGVLAALNRLVQTAGPDDIVYVHYSGHGSQVRDRNGDEVDRLDETLVPYDGRTPGIRDIVDDELDALFARLRARSALIVLDSCHSGTATRSVEVRTRAIPPDDRDELYEVAAELRTRALVPVPSERYLVLSAAASNEEALDGPVDGRFHGFFSYSLARSVATLPMASSAREVFAGIGRELGRIQQRFGRVEMPTPQLEGPPALFDLPVLPPAVASAPERPPSSSRPQGARQEPARPATAGPPSMGRLAFVPVMPLPPDRVLLGRAGVMGGAIGSRWAVYPPEDTKFAPGGAIAVVTVVSAAGDDAIARIGTSIGPIPPSSRAVLLLPPPAAQRVAVRLGNLPPATRARVTEILGRDVVNVAVVGEDQPARFVIDSAGDALRLTTADGLQVVREFSASDVSAGMQLATEIDRSRLADELLSMDNPAASLQVQAQVVTHPALVTRGLAVVADTTPARYRVRRDGEARTPQNSLQLEIRVDTDAFLTIASVDSQGGINLLFPNPFTRDGFHPDGRIAAGETVRVPDSLAPSNRAGFYWDYAPPAGTDTIRVFASTDLDTADVLRSRIRAMQSASTGTPTARGVLAGGVVVELAALRDQLAGLATRGIRTVAANEAVGGAPAEPSELPAAGDWAAASVTVSVGD
jgi:hypothetical protein